MPEFITPKGIPDIVNLQESQHCCFCGSIILKRKQMWKYPDGWYMCIVCKTRVDQYTTEGTSYSRKKGG